MKLFSFRQISKYERIIKQNTAYTAAVAHHLGDAWEELMADKKSENGLHGMTEEQMMEFQLASRNKLRDQEREAEASKKGIVSDEFEKFKQRIQLVSPPTRNRM